MLILVQAELTFTTDYKESRTTQRNDLEKIV